MQAPCLHTAESECRYTQTVLVGIEPLRLHSQPPAVEKLCRANLLIAIHHRAGVQGTPLVCCMSSLPFFTLPKWIDLFTL